MVKRLCRSRENKVIAGVCGGIAEYFSTDPTIVRLVWGATFFLGGTGFIAYIVAAIIMPKKEFDSHGDFFSNSRSDEFDYPNGSEFDKHFYAKTGSGEFDASGDYKRSKPDKKIFGIILIVLGAFFLAKEYLKWVDDQVLIPFLLIVVGLVFIFGNRRRF
ncbi:PspC domain-containing protein [Pseudobacteroides cellulosolvens]|uniref:Phage shock protein C, PspC n=1 Tax=Pseudobacteroides cellulosolvens ATCC 35603 = DSM 2933 TaxID=398512 RepID=A0A0L6JT54_9FIRM|nr:PspC domain-containing protein [Pseudobacteroides cellulosolvens]KNY28602.1 phage shock protein C, PspC [Pseudobacteroides cellulosolvens ATCC 35603 = DSM 2933]